MTPEEVAATLAARTPGPWDGCAHVNGTDSDCPCRYRGDVFSKATDEVVFMPGVGPTGNEGAEEFAAKPWRDIKSTSLEQGYADARAIVVAVNLAEPLLRVAEAARETAAWLDRVQLMYHTIVQQWPTETRDTCDAGMCGDMRLHRDALRDALAALDTAMEALT